MSSIRVIVDESSTLTAPAVTETPPEAASDGSSGVPPEIGGRRRSRHTAAPAGTERKADRGRELDVDRMRASLATLSAQVETLVADIRSVGSFRLSEVKLSVEVTAEGGFALIGTAKAGVSGGLTLTFTIPDG